MQVTGQEVIGFVLEEIPEENRTIANDVKINELVPHMMIFDVYSRCKEACPFGRGNWVIDIRFADDTLICLKLPLAMTEKQVMAYVKPLVDLLEEQNKQKMN